MPLLQINTNISIAHTGTIASEASKLVAQMLGKPESYVMVMVTPDLPMIFAGSDAATAHLKLKSLGLPEADTARYSKQLCDFVEQKLGIQPSRTYIEFAAPARHMWGWDSSTF